MWQACFQSMDIQILLASTLVRIMMRWQRQATLQHLMMPLFFSQKSQGIRWTSAIRTGTKLFGPIVLSRDQRTGKKQYVGVGKLSCSQSPQFF